MLLLWTVHAQLWTHHRKAVPAVHREGDRVDPAQQHLERRRACGLESRDPRQRQRRWGNGVTEVDRHVHVACCQRVQRLRWKEDAALQRRGWCERPAGRTKHRHQLAHAPGSAGPNIGQVAVHVVEGIAVVAQRSDQPKQARVALLDPDQVFELLLVLFDLLLRVLDLVGGLELVPDLVLVLDLDLERDLDLVADLHYLLK